MSCATCRLMDWLFFVWLFECALIILGLVVHIARGGGGDDGIL